MSDEYIYNSAHKEHIRSRWVDFMHEIMSKKEDQENGLRIITFPAEAMHDLQLFEQEGFISWEKTETGSYSITNGDVICFEKSETIYRILTKKLSRGKVYREFGAYITREYKTLLKNTDIFPADVINLDYEKNISKNEVPIDVLARYIFEFQSKHKRPFSLFLTWPIPNQPEDDEETFRDQLKSTIENNLTDPNARKFKDQFSISYSELSAVEYPPLSIIGVTKLILRHSSQYGFQLNRNEFYVYGEEGRRKMISVLYNFLPPAERVINSILYANDVAKALSPIAILQ